MKSNKFNDRKNKASLSVIINLFILIALLAIPGSMNTATSPVASAEAANSHTLTKEQRQAIESVVRDSTSQIWFEKNVGQFAKDVRYGFRTSFGSMLVYDDHLQMLVNQTDSKTKQVGVHIVNMSFVGGNAAWQIVPGKLSVVTGTYQNADGTASHPDIFKELTLRNVYDGVDLRLYSAAKGTVEFDWLVAHAQDYQKIQTAFTGQDGISYGADGTMTFNLRYQNLTMKMPETYQLINGVKQSLNARMVAGNVPNTMRYQLSGNIIADQPLVIDPSIVWSTYIDLNDAAYDSYVFAVAVNGNGVYVGGWMRETVTNAVYGGPGNYMEVNAGFSIGTAINQNYIYRLNNTGMNVTAWTSTGRAGDPGNPANLTNQKYNAAFDAVADIALFPDGRVLVGFASGFIQIYAANLSTQNYSAEPVTLDTLNAVAIKDDNVFYTSGRILVAAGPVGIPVAQIPLANIGPDTTFGVAGTLEGVIIRYSTATTTPTPNWATYVGGDAGEYFTAIEMTPDKTRLAFVTTTASTTGLPALVNPIDNVIAGTELLVGVLADGATKPAAFNMFSYLGGVANEGTAAANTAAAVVTTATIAGSDYFYVAGNADAASVNMPGSTLALGGIGNGAQTAPSTNGDVFISRIPIAGCPAAPPAGCNGTGFQTTYLGGTTLDQIGGIAFDSAASQLLVFGTTSAGGLTTKDTVPPSAFFQAASGGGNEIFVGLFNNNLLTMPYLTYIGGANNDYLGATGNLLGQGHVVYSAVTGLSYLATTVHSVLPVAAIGTPGGKDLTGNAANNDTHTVFAFNLNNNDYGDAPLTYDNGAAANAANSAISATIRIGATVDAEAGPASGVTALGDDTANTGSADDEDGIAALSALNVGDTTYSATVSVLNNSGAARTLQGWIDFNRDGTFEVGEYASVSVPTSAAVQNPVLTWSPLPALTAGQSYLRLRLNDAALTDNAGTATIDERSIGLGGSGEVEDYALTIASVADLAVTKTDSKTTYTPGGAITYTVVVSNGGPSSAIGATVADTIPANITGATWTCAASAGASCTASGAGNINDTVTIPNAGNVTYTITGTVNVAAVGTLTNTATATVAAGTTDPVAGNNSASDSDLSSVCAAGQFTRWDFENVLTPSIGSGTFTAVNVTGPGYVAGVTGQAVSYSNWPLVVATTNYYDFAVSTVGRGSIQMTFNESRSATGPVTFVAYYSPDGITYTPLGAGIATTATPAWGAQTINFSAITALNDNPNAHFRLYAYSATGAAGTWRLDNVSFTGNCLADLSVTKTDGSATYTAGTNTTYTVVASNLGPSNVTAATLTDTFPAAITSANWTCIAAGGAVCPAASGSGNINATINLPSGSSLTYTITAAINSNATGNLVNTATITAPAGVTDPVAGNNSATDTDTPAPVSDLVVTKTDGVAAVNAGGTTTYTLTLTNNGPSAANNSTLSDPAVAGLTKTAIGVCTPAAGAVCPTVGAGAGQMSIANLEAGTVAVPTLPSGGSISFTVTVNVTAVGGTVANTFTSTPPGGTTDPTPATVTDTDNVNPIADLVVTKTDGVAAVNAGGTTTYTLTLTNNGPSAANNSTISDPAVAGLTKTAIGVCTPAGGAVCPTVGAGAGQMSIANLQAGTVVVPTLPSGGSISFTVTVNVTAVGGTVANTFTSTPPGGTTDPTPATVTDTDNVNPIADLVVTKTDGVAAVNAGGTTTYTLTLTNNGPSAANNSTIGDPAVAGLTKTAIGVCTPAGGAVCPTVGAGAGQMSIANLEAGTVQVPTLPNGGSISFTVTVNVTATNGTVANTFTSTPPGGTTDPTPATVTDTDNVTPIADLVVTKTDGVAAVNAGGTTTYTLTLTNNGPSAANNATLSDPAVAGLTKTAIGVCTPAGGAVCPTVGAGAGQMSIANLQAGTVVVPTLPSGGSISFTVTVNVTATNGTVANTFTSTPPGGTTDPTPATVTDTDNVNPIADLVVTKTDGVAAVNAGGTTTYTLTLTNNGPSAANNSTLSDPAVAGLTKTAIGVCVPAGGAVCPTVGAGAGQMSIANLQAGTVVVPTLPSGGSISFSVTVNVTATNGSVANTFTATPPTGTADPTPATATDIDTVTPIADLEVTKTDGVASVNASGTTTYTIVVTNHGPSAADNTVFTDPAVAGLNVTAVTCGSASGGAACPIVANTTVALMQGAGIVIPTLPSGGSVTFTVTATVTATSGSVANTANVAPPAGTTDPGVFSNTASDTDAVINIIAVNDTGATVNGTAGGQSLANVLTNDTLNGNPATLANINLTQVSTTNAGVTLDVTTGAINVAPGTAAGNYTVTYQICDQANPTICDTATVSVPVVVINAVNDTGSVVDGTVGGQSFANVLTNDTLNGNPATLANITLTQVSTTNAGVTLDVTTGAINVAPGTAAGNYTVTYQICDQANPTICDTATVSVPVVTINAVNDVGATVNGTVGGQALANVLINDTLNGNPATLANITLTQVSTTNAGVTLDVTTGAVNVAAGTPAGNYTVTYKICDQANATICDTATVSVPVVVINAVNDTGATVNGTAGGQSLANVLTNDTLNGNPATLANITLTQVSTTNAGVTLDVTTGAVNVAAGTPAGNYTVTYQICDQANVTICDTATVSVPVVVINAVNDTGATVNGTAGGQSLANVLTNDTLNGNPATLANINLTQVSTTNAGVTLDVTTGAVNVAAGTPAGNYTVTYQICDKANSTICDTATVSVSVVTINAVNDTGSVVNGTAGGQSLANVLTNDTLNGNPATLANITLTQVLTTNAGVTLDVTTGAINVAAGTPAGNYTVTYQICDQANATICDTATVSVPVVVINAVNDIGATVDGTVGGQSFANVLTNDTLNGNPATLVNINLTQVSTTNPGVTLNVATGAVNVAPGTPAGNYTVTYQICDKANAAICDTATVSVPVVVVNAVNDTGSSVDGTAGGQSLANVLTNDTLNGNPATLANITLTQVSTTNVGVTLNTANGSVNVAPGTPAGNYTVTYKICDQANATICDTATVSVPVVVINAVNDTGATVDGTAGGVSLANVLTNDTLNGNPATLANINLTQVSTTNAGITLDITTGAVNVAPGTPAGNYTVTYQICDQANPAICDTATVSVPVVVINAVNDTGATIDGAVGGQSFANVLTNDTLNGNPATLANINLTQVSTTNVGVTLNPANGSVNVAAGTAAGNYTVTYKICDKAHPAICDTATVSVPVVTINAVNDTGANVDGTAGGQSLADVLTNDTLNGNPVTLANITLTQVSTTNAGVTLDVTTGAVNVAPGTPAGNYTVTYQICDQANATICDTATVSVPVVVINAVNDTGSTMDGTAGGTSLANVLTNDTLNSNPATLVNINLTQVSTTNPGVTLNVATGAVNVAPGTPAGNYTVTYQICDKANTTICDTATVSVPVVAINAVNDTGAIVDGTAGGQSFANVLTNDTLNGNPATLANINLTQVSTTNPGVTLDVTTGAVNVAAGTPAGNYIVTYKICDQANAAICDTATVSIPVVVINAVNDTGASVNGSVGGQSLANVLTNDTLNGNPATLANITLTQVSTTNAGVTLNTANGSVNVAAGTVAGNYTVMYQICDQANATICDTATVSVQVTAAPINAVDDVASGVNGITGATAVLNVFTNDTLNGVAVVPANVVLTQTVADPGGALTLNANGTVDVAAGTAAGTYQLTYRICEVLNPANCDTAIARVTVGLPPAPTATDDSTTTPFNTPATLTNITANDTAFGAGNSIVINTVDLDPATAGQQTSFTDTSGNQWSVNTTTGDVTFTPATNYTGTATIPYAVQDAAGQIATANLSVTVDPPASISGVVFNDADLNGTKSGSESGINGVTVKLYDSTGTTLIATVTTSAGGAYSFPNLTAGTYLVVETDPAGYVSSTANSVSATITAGGSATVNFGDYQLPNTAPSTINGTVFNDINGNGTQDVGETALSNVTVQLKNNLGVVIATTTTNASGGYSFTNLTAGTYTVTETDLAGYTSTTLNNVTVILSAGATATVNFGDQISGQAAVADPAVTKLGSPTNGTVGSIVVYTITVGNNGNTDAANVVLTDTKPAFLDIIAITISPNPGLTPVISGNTFTINFGTVKPTDSYIVTVLTRVNSLGKPPGGSNNVSITTSSVTDRAFNNTSSANLQISANSGNSHPKTLPNTGFAPGVVTDLSHVPAVKYSNAGDIVLEVPALGIKISIVGVPQEKDGTWNVAWLGNQAGWLEGTAFPTWSGNSVLTSHVYLSNGLPGPFVNLNKLKYGDQIIVHAYGQKYIFEVSANSVVEPNDTSIFNHEVKPWLTLITCKEYDQKTNTYKQRVVVRAVLVSVGVDK